MTPPRANAPTLRLEDAAGLVRVEAGAFVAGRRTLFSLFRDEMFFAPAFFDHYRGIGVEQFLILDDGSTDGTRAFLAAQPDCVLLGSDLAYGRPIVIVDPAGRAIKERAGVYFKMAVPQTFVAGDYVLYVDADEFLFLPPEVAGLDEVIARLRDRGDACCVAAIVEFFPETVARLRSGAPPASLADLLADYGFFQPEPMVEIDADGAPQPVGRSKSTRLFEAHGVRVEQRGLRKRLIAMMAPMHRKSPQFKTPIFRCDADTHLANTHVCNRPAPRDLLLTIGHFVFTAQFADKVERALDWRSHANGSDKYEHYARLLARLEAGAGRLTDPASARFVAPRQFVDAGLMRW